MNHLFGDSIGWGIFSQSARIKEIVKKFAKLKIYVVVVSHSLSLIAVGLVRAALDKSQIHHIEWRQVPSITLPFSTIGG